MASDRSITAIAILLFTIFTQGHFGILDRSYSVNVTVGQQVALHCLMEKEHSYKIPQIEWKKMEGRLETKIAVYNPRYGPAHLYWKNVSIHLEEPGGVLKGSVLWLTEVNVQDSGIYVCELTTFPDGTVKAETHLRVTAIEVYAKVTRPIQAVREGDDVIIHCSSTPAASSYSLWPSQNDSSIIKSEEGEFMLPNVMRGDSGIYICQPENSSSGPSFHRHSATVNVTVNYLDEIECDMLPDVKATAGQNVTVTCAASASQNSQYTWRKGNVTVSMSASLHLWSVSPEQAGLYTLTAVVKDTGLQRQMEFNVTVRTGSEDLTSSTTPPTSTTTNENNTAVSTATEESASIIFTSMPAQAAGSSAPGRNVTTGFTRPFSTDKALPLNTTLHPFEYNGTDVENASSHGQTAATRSHRTSVTAADQLPNYTGTCITSDINVTPTGSRDGMRYIIFIVLLVLALLFLIVFLYRRHMVKRKINMPPPFKPPPPPVKYTSVKTQEARVTIQQPQAHAPQQHDRARGCWLQEVTL